MFSRGAGTKKTKNFSFRVKDLRSAANAAGAGGSADKVEVKFGDDGSERFATLTELGAFADFTSEKIFEGNGRGILASL